MQTALITGTSTGLGQELARALLARGDRVFGVARSPATIDDANYRHLQADVTAADYPKHLQNHLSTGNVQRLDLLINNAGSETGGKTITDINIDEVRHQFNLHCVAAMATVQTLLPLLHNSKIVNITSRLGSVKCNQRGDFAGRGFTYSYRVAKAAQNMFSICLAEDEHAAGNIIISLIPGLLFTACGPSDASHTAAEGAAAALKTILAANTSGVYHSFGDEATY